MTIFFSCQTPPDDTPEDPIEQQDPIEPDEIEDPVEEEFVVTEEIYQTTFSEIELLIEQLNQTISSREFDQWKDYLSNSYLQTYSDEEKLEEISQSPILMNNDIRVESLEDYFNYIVVPSRSNIVVNDIEFESENMITVWSMFNGRSVKLYQLEKIDEAWYISIW